MCAGYREDEIERHAPGERQVLDGPQLDHLAETRILSLESFGGR